MTPPTEPYYVTTPIYYVNDRPHIGHCYTTLIGDLAARAQRLIGGPDRPVFFLTGTDEHAEKVSKSAAEHGKTPMAWATLNADRFKDAFAFMNFSHDDFVRTTEDRHTSRASAYIERLMKAGEIELGDYTGWYDPSQEEYLTETQAKDADFKSPVTGKPLEQRTEQNYFFRLDKPEYTEFLLDLIEKGERAEPGGMRILPEARKNEVLGRIRQGLQRVPVSRRIKEGDPDWGIKMPGDPEHRIYVWIEALCNYLTVVDEPERRQFWHAPVHLMAKDILWFHAVIWPCMLRALGETPPDTVYAHAYWIAEGKKMSKSLGNFIEIDQLRAYADRYSLDAVRWYMATQGPLGANDADFAHARFVEVYNADLANGIGNATSRVANMIAKYFDEKVPSSPPRGFASESHGYSADSAGITSELVAGSVTHLGNLDLDLALNNGIRLVSLVDDLISTTRPFTLAKVGPGTDEWSQVEQILGIAAEQLRIASLLLYPAMPQKMAELWRRWNCDHLTDPNDENSAFKAPLAELAEWGGKFSLKPGQTIEKGDALFMRADAADPAPGA